MSGDVEPMATRKPPKVHYSVFPCQQDNAHSTGRMSDVTCRACAKRMKREGTAMAEAADRVLEQFTGIEPHVREMLRGVARHICAVNEMEAVMSVLSKECERVGGLTPRWKVRRAGPDVKTMMDLSLVKLSGREPDHDRYCDERFLRYGRVPKLVRQCIVSVVDAVDGWCFSVMDMNAENWNIRFDGQLLSPGEGGLSGSE